MRYLLMICTDETADEALSADEASARFAEYGVWMEEVTKRGLLQGGERLRPTTDATTVRVRDGETLTSDGPFAETKEQVGGFYLLEASSLDEAVKLASMLPEVQASHSGVEIRPVVDHGVSRS